MLRLRKLITTHTALRESSRPGRRPYDHPPRGGETTTTYEGSSDASGVDAVPGLSPASVSGDAAD
jgi:hypothetical protein